MRYAYLIDLLHDADGVTVTMSDVPELVTCGNTVAEALARVPDALVSALSFYTDEDKAVPHPGDARGRPVVAVPILVATKLALHEAMLEAKISNVELGRRMGMGETLIRRLRDPLHRSHIDQVEAALRILGRQVVIDVAASEVLAWEPLLASAAA
jgi:antitoxin HicB